MIVPSPNFLLFAAAVAIAVNLGSAASWRQGMLLIANLLFLSSFSHDITAFVPFAGFLALGYIAQRITRDGSMPRLFVALLLVTIGAFFWLKRYTFIPNAAFLQFPYLLVGLSYVFFRVVHLIIDSHQGAVEEKVGVLSYLNYTMNFTCLTSGPIQRYQDYRRSEVDPPPLTIAASGRAFERIVIGYFKVAIVSMVLSVWQHQAIDTIGLDQTLLDRVWSGVAIVGIYPLYLFFNFSGYTDVVIGVARFLRIELPENFDRPFASGNFIQFWSRWHITLSNWLKTYVYNPLMMLMMARVTAPRVAPYLAVFAFFVTFFLVGLWHGQTSEFLFFGFLQGGGVAANKLYQELMTRNLGRTQYRSLCANRLYAACSRGLTFTWFAFTLLWFWSNWGQIGGLNGELGGLATALAFLLLFALATVSLTILEAGRSAVLRMTWSVDPGVRGPIITSRYARTVWSTAIVVVTVVVVVILASPAPDIVYKTF
jgi:alginate O-acetyltransferase complex protein AlgI